MDALSPRANWIFLQALAHTLPLGINIKSSTNKAHTHPSSVSTTNLTEQRSSLEIKNELLMA